MSKKMTPFLRHIITEADYLLEKSKDLEFEVFINNETLKRSFVRSLEVIGEAAKNLFKDFRKKYAHIKWEKIVWLRDILIHQYFGIDYKTVWDIIKNQVPFLKEQIETILKEIKDKNEI
ncbi:MAG TPA: DUF86 domain-containing protein [Candidatus Deferrimicrobium sp.]|nr:DUF86 domain-containing protein [Candidatus Deferrimicrobium sp.]